jgi:hypothetical protein
MEVSYGFDGPSVQYFLSVSDTRLRWRADASREANQICRALCQDGMAPGGGAGSGAGTCGGGGGAGAGAYFVLHTGPSGAGRRVTPDTLAEFWDRYGVPRDHVLAMLQARRKF